MKKRGTALIGLLAAAFVTMGTAGLPVSAETISGEITDTTGADTTGTDGAETGTDTTGTDGAETGTDTTGTDGADTTGAESSADEEVVVTEEDKPYLSLGADLSAEQRATVLSLLGVTEEQLAEFDVTYVTNAEEHEYLDAYISSDKIGTKSLSSVVVMEGEKGTGIQVTTKNISYCTVGMYQNALATAGVEDAQVIVAGPTSISGTAGLVGVLKAYEVMTGEEISEESVDTALNELVITGEIADNAEDSDTIEGAIAYIKQDVVANGLDDEESIGNAVDEACEEFNITLTPDERQKIVNLMKKISDLDLDADTLETQAKSIYDKVNSLLGEDTMQNIKDKLGSEETKNFFLRIFEKVKAWLSALFS